MLRWFKRKKKIPVPNPLQEKLVNGIVTKVNILQSRWAALMQRISERYSTRTKKTVTVLSVLFASVYSLYIIAASITERPEKSFVLSTIHSPAYITKSGDEKLYTKTIISEKEYNKVIRFDQYMDSLKLSASGKRIADSLAANRPGLIDSAKQVRRLFEIQQTLKNKS